jgi:drug/metabolite transporter (DMT)-like permease
MSKPNKAQPWLLDFFLLAAIWGSSFMFMRIAVREFGALPTAGLRVLIGALFLVPIMLSKGLSAELHRHWKLTFGVGILNSGIPFACLTFALLSISSGLSAILNATVPMFGAFIAWAWLKDRPSVSRLVGLVIGMAGVAMLAWDKASFTPDAQGVTTGWAILAALFAFLCYGVSASIAKKYMGGIPSLVSATGSQIGAAIGLAPAMVYFWPKGPVSWGAWGCALVLGVVCSGFAYILYFRLIERAGPARALAVTFAVPVFAVTYGVVLLSEAVTLWMLLCAGVIVVGTALSTGLMQLQRTANAIKSLCVNKGS